MLEFIVSVLPALDNVTSKVSKSKKEVYKHDKS